MSSTYSATDTVTFTVTHARHLAAKIATDLKRLQRLYNQPSDAHIANLEGEVTELLRQGYLKRVTYGFKRNGAWIEPTLRYTASELSNGADDDPGRITPNANVTGAAFHSYLVHTDAWLKLPAADRLAIEKGLPVQRVGADEPQVNGYFSDDRCYTSGGRSLGRASVRSF